MLLQVQVPSRLCSCLKFHHFFAELFWRKSDGKFVNAIMRLVCVEAYMHLLCQAHIVSSWLLQKSFDGPNFLDCVFMTLL